MIYLGKFVFPSNDNEFGFFLEIKRKCYTTIYLFQVLAFHEKLQSDFQPFTILYGGNGSGKTTALNVTAEVLKLKKKKASVFNQSNFYDDYLKLCQYRLEEEFP